MAIFRALPSADSIPVDEYGMYRSPICPHETQWLTGEMAAHSQCANCHTEEQRNRLALGERITVTLSEDGWEVIAANGEILALVDEFSGPDPKSSIVHCWIQTSDGCYWQGQGTFGGKMRMWRFKDQENNPMTRHRAKQK